MKILYAVQATGNGHISRAMEILPHLEKYGQTDIFLSGSNSALPMSNNVKYRSKGISLFYSGNGSLSYPKIAASLAPIRVWNEVRSLPVEKYDLVINDFESITAMACAYKKVPSVQFGHQASFLSDKTPRPQHKNLLGELILKYYARATKNIGLHFESYDDFILPPVIKNEIWNGITFDQGYITVYLLAYSDKKIAKYLSQLKKYKFEVFSREVTSKVQVDNITFLPVDKALFNKSLLNCHGIITGAGFETPAEALHLEKKLMVIPVKKQYEQLCNAEALKKYNVPVLHDLDDTFTAAFEKWIATDESIDMNYRKNTASIIDTMFHMAFTPDSLPQEYFGFPLPA